MGAATGISTNFATGDNGDFTAYGIPATVLAPADSPWATGVGGVSLALNPDNSIAWQSGWGNNEVLLAETGYVYDPPLAFGFYAGSGGAPATALSRIFTVTASPAFPSRRTKKKLPGKYRQLPDISWLADPFTGAAILISISGAGSGAGVAGVGWHEPRHSNVLRLVGHRQRGGPGWRWYRTRSGRTLCLLAAGGSRVRYRSG